MCVHVVYCPVSTCVIHTLITSRHHSGLSGRCCCQTLFTMTASHVYLHTPSITYITRQSRYMYIHEYSVFRKVSAVIVSLKSVTRFEDIADSEPALCKSLLCWELASHTFFAVIVSLKSVTRFEDISIQCCIMRSLLRWELASHTFFAQIYSVHYNNTQHR